MNGTINGRVINGAAAAWVVRAQAHGTAAAVFAECAPVRVVYATARIDASVVVTVTTAHEITARAQNTASAVIGVTPTLMLSGAADAQATAALYAAVRRDVWAQASGEASCYFEALLAQAIGTASAQATATVERAQAHVVHPAVSRGAAGARAHVVGADVVRYAKAEVLAKARQAWGEASVRRNGSHYFEHDGYAHMAGQGSLQVLRDRLHISTLYGLYDVGESVMRAKAFVVYPATAVAHVRSEMPPVVANNAFFASAQAQALAAITATGVRIRMVQTIGVARAKVFDPVPRVRYVARVHADARATVDRAIAAQRMIVRRVSFVARAYQAKDLVLGVQHWGRVLSVRAQAQAAPAVGNVCYQATVQTAVARASVQRCVGHLIVQGSVNDAIAKAAWGRAYALLNSDVKAPDERYMWARADVRGMRTSAENRMMVAI